MAGFFDIRGHPCNPWLEILGCGQRPRSALCIFALRSIAAVGHNHDLTRQQKPRIPGFELDWSVHISLTRERRSQRYPRSFPAAASLVRRAPVILRSDWVFFALLCVLFSTLQTLKLRAACAHFSEANVTTKQIGVREQESQIQAITLPVP